jgi:hypothetical protein
VRDRIEFLVRQEAVVLAEKRKRIEEMLWAIHEANIGDLWETYEATKVGKDGKAEIDEAGKMLTLRKQRPRLLSDLSPDLCKVIEDVDVDAKGNVIPRLYSKLQANRELRRPWSSWPSGTVSELPSWWTFAGSKWTWKTPSCTSAESNKALRPRIP